MNLAVNTSDKDAIGLIHQAIAKRKAFALCRFGDGEFCFINGRSSPSILKQFCRNWGFSYPKDLPKARQAFMAILVKAMAQADLIGILKPKTSVSKRLGYDPKTWSTPFSRLRSLGIASPKSLKVCDHQITRGIAMGSPEGMARLLNGEPVHIMSCRTTQLQKNNLAKHLKTKITYTQVDSHLHLTAEVRKWLMDQVEKIEEFVVLIALGPLGKDLPVLLKERGKIGLDMGATIDGWASVASRPWFKSIQKHCML